MSTRPCTCGLSSAMSLPMSRMVAAPVVSKAAWTSWSSSCWLKAEGRNSWIMASSASSLSASSCRPACWYIEADSRRCFAILSSRAWMSASLSCWSRPLSIWFFLMSASIKRKVASLSLAWARKACLLAWSMRCSSSLMLPMQLRISC